MKHSARIHHRLSEKLHPTSLCDNFQEDELYTWLLTNKGYDYGDTKAQVNSEKLFLEHLASIIKKRITFGILEERLNIHTIQLSQVEQQYNRQLEGAKQEVLQYDRS